MCLREVTNDEKLMEKLRRGRLTLLHDNHPDEDKVLLKAAAKTSKHQDGLLVYDNLHGNKSGSDVITS